MKVILLQDVKKIGKKGQVVEVADGLARNMLIPQKKARIATTTVVKDAHEQQKNVAHKKETHTQAIKDFLKSLDGRVCTHTARCNEKGGLYQALDAARIADIITTETKGKCDPAWIVIDQPIKQSGEHMVTLAYDGMQVVVSIVVESQ